MKANEAPEKIYLDDSMSTDTAGELWSDALWFDTKVSDDSIEYVRKDTFIEKAENYLRNKCQRFILTEKDIDDFKKFIVHISRGDRINGNRVYGRRRKVTIPKRSFRNQKGIVGFQNNT